MALFTLLAFPMRVVGFLLEEMPRRSSSLERLDRVLAAAPAVRARAIRARCRRGPLAVEVDGVEFAYPAGEPVLQRLRPSQSRPGEVVALVGPTGCGKSTLCDLARRARSRPTAASSGSAASTHRGRAAASLRDRVALVFQESFLFADTVGENITLGTDASDAERLRWAAGDRPGRAASSTRCRTGTTPSSASGASRSRAVSGSGSRSPARWSVARGCWSSTTRPRRSTRRSKRGSSRCCARSST